MRFAAWSIDVTYEAVFATPAFDLASRNVSALRALYEAISPRFPISMQNLQASGGTSVADLRVRATLFNGHGVLEISAERLSAVFTQLRSRSDTEIAKDCVRLAQAALRTALPDTRNREENINCVAYLELVNDSQSANDYLDNLMSKQKIIRPGSFNASDVHYGLSAEIRDSAAGWKTSLRVDAARFDPRILIINCHTTYPAEGTLRSFEDQAGHVEKILETATRELGLEMAKTS